MSGQIAIALNFGSRTKRHESVGQIGACGVIELLKALQTSIVGRGQILPDRLDGLKKGLLMLQNVSGCNPLVPGAGVSRVATLRLYPRQLIEGIARVNGCYGPPGHPS